MLKNTIDLLKLAEEGSFAIGAFNVYNMEGAMSVIGAAEEEGLPAMIQIHPASMAIGGKVLAALCLTAAEESVVPVSVHLDHSENSGDIERALSYGIRSIMVDGSKLGYQENAHFTKEWSRTVHNLGGFVEGELGRLSGTEENLTSYHYESKLTDPNEVADFVCRSEVDALAVCIGNVHGEYPKPPSLDFKRLREIERFVQIPLVLHGASGLPDNLVEESIDLGVRKLNVNTEIRQAYIGALRNKISMGNVELTDIMNATLFSMREVIRSKIRQFAGR